MSENGAFFPSMLVFSNNELGLIEIPLKKGNHEIIIEYDNFSFGLVILSIVISFLILMFTLKIFLKEKNETNTI